MVLGETPGTVKVRSDASVRWRPVFRCNHRDLQRFRKTLSCWRRAGKMPKNARVVVQYGPYEACGVVESRKSRLAGLEARLTGDGHSVEFQEMQDWNVVRLIVNGENVYKCAIKELDYGGDGELDPLCSEAVKAVQEAY